MSMKIGGLLLGGTALTLVVGCGGVSVGNGDEVRVTIQAQYEKRDLGSGGFGAASPRPARFIYAEVVEPSGHVIAGDYLGSGIDSPPQTTG